MGVCDLYLAGWRRNYEEREWERREGGRERRGGRREEEGRRRKEREEGEGGRKREEGRREKVEEEEEELKDWSVCNLHLAGVASPTLSSSRELSV